MAWFRRKRGRHELGFAAVARPELAAVVPDHPAVPAPAPAYTSAPAPRSAPVPDIPAAALAPSAATAVAVLTRPVEPSPVRDSGPRVELGFRDGTTAVLVPGSAPFLALAAVASALRRRD